MSLDILSFDTASDCEQGFDLEVTHPDGVTLTGVTLTIIGAHADAVQKWSARLVDKMRRDEWLAKKAGKEPEPVSLDELKAQNIEGAAIRVVGWKGVKQEFDRELLKAALKRNPHWIDQINEASNDLGNFGKKPSQS